MPGFSVAKSAKAPGIPEWGWASKALGILDVVHAAQHEVMGSVLTSIQHQELGAKRLAATP